MIKRRDLDLVVTSLHSKRLLQTFRTGVPLIPVLVFLLFQAMYPHSFRVIQGDASYYHLLRAVQFSRYGGTALTVSPDVQAQQGGEPGIYPPLVHVWCAVLISNLGIESGYEVATALMVLVLIAGISILANAAWDSRAAVVSGLLFFFIASQDWWLTILNALTYTLGLALLAAAAVIKKRPVLLTILLIVLFYSHLCACVIIPTLLIWNIILHGKQRPMLIPFALAMLLYLPYLGFFLTQIAAISGPDHRLYLWPANDHLKLLSNALLFLVGALVVCKDKDRPGLGPILIIGGLLSYCVFYRWNHIPHVLPVGTALLAGNLLTKGFDRLHSRSWYLLTVGGMIVLFLKPSLIPVPGDHLGYMLPWQYRNLSTLGSRAHFISEYQRLALILNPYVQSNKTVAVEGDLKDVNGIICFLPVQVESGGIKRIHQPAATDPADTVIRFSLDQVVIADSEQMNLRLRRFGSAFSDWVKNPPSR